MAVKSLRAAPPSDDKRWLLVNAAMRRYGYQPDALIEALHTVQESFGYIDPLALRFVADSLNVPLSHAYGVATFYHFFSLKKLGRHSCVICTGTACYIKGSGDLLHAIEEKFGVADGETSPDGELSILTARCLGACGLAPAAVLDSEVMPKQTAEEIVTLITEALSNGKS